jgi:hypothetical protein
MAAVKTTDTGRPGGSGSPAGDGVEGAGVDSPQSEKLIERSVSVAFLITW